MNEKDIEVIIKKYSENKEYPILEIIDDDEMSAYFGVFEGTLEFDQLSKIESEIVSKISEFNVSTRVECGLSLFVTFSPVNTFDGDAQQYEELLDNACRLTKEILTSYGISNFTKSSYDAKSSC